MSIVDRASDDVAARLARWTERDAAIGLSAELEQTAARLAEREREVVDLRARNERLAQQVAQLTVERDRLYHEVQSLRRTPFVRRAYLKARRVAGRVLRG